MSTFLPFVADNDLSAHRVAERCVHQLQRKNRAETKIRGSLVELSSADTQWWRDGRNLAQPLDG